MLGSMMEDTKEGTGGSGRVGVGMEREEKHC